MSVAGAYKASKNIYDDVLTETKWWAKLYTKIFWGGVSSVETAAKVLEMIPAGFAGKLLDVPAGTAVFTFEKYRELSGADITCLDYSADMLEQARERFGEKNINNVKCVQGDVGNLAFEDAGFDIVLSMNGFHAFPDKNKAFLETARVLKKGGMFCGCFYIKGQNKRTDFIVKHFLAKRGWFTPPFQTFDELQGKLHSLYSGVEIENMDALVYFKCTK